MLDVGAFISYKVPANVCKIFTRSYKISSHFLSCKGPNQILYQCDVLFKTEIPPFLSMCSTLKSHTILLRKIIFSTRIWMI